MANTTQTEHALVTLRQRILGGHYEGGERLYEVALATDLEISRTPIRAALSKLAEEGLLDRAKGGGFSIRRFDIRDVIDTIELRGLLEGTAARLAAERGADPQAMDSMRESFDSINKIISEKDADLSGYARWNAVFHDAMARAPGSAVIAREIARVTSLPFASPSAFLTDHRASQGFRHLLDVAQEQHRALIEAIEQRQGARAEWLAREHARQAHRNVTFLISDAAPSTTPTPLALVSG